MATYLTSDTHFYHQNVIKYDERPFRNVEEMNAALIQRWNEVVGEDDVVYHLGDFSMAGIERTALVRSQLKGIIHLVRGNHDNGRNVVWKTFAGVYRQLELEIDGVRCWMSHYPHGNWPRRKEGVIHLHGHSHGWSERILKGRFDVGCMLWDYRPVSISTILNSREGAEEGAQ